MNWKELYAEALTYADFLARYGTDAHRARWQSAYERVSLNTRQQALLAAFDRQMHLLCLAGTWCGDCVREGAILQRIAEASPRITLRFLDREGNPEAAAALEINAGRRIPVVVFLSEDFMECARYGERTLATYRAMAAKAGLGVVSSGGVVAGSSVVATGSSVVASEAKPPSPEEHYAAVVQDWLDEIERVQLLLRLSPRLRAIHGD